MKRGEMFPSRFLAAEDLKGRAVGVTIERLEQEEIGSQKDLKWVVYFRGKEKGLVLNVTNADAIFDVYESTEDWPGKRIELYPSKTKFAGKTVPCIRVRLPGANKSQSEPEPEEPPIPDEGEHPEEDDEVPF